MSNIIFRSMSRNAITLAIFAAATTAATALTVLATQEKIDHNIRVNQESKLYELLPADTHNNSMLEDTQQLTHRLLGDDKTHIAYIARQNGKPVGAVIEAIAPEGYGGKIKLLVGIYADGTVAGIRMIPPHNETPGLGDAIDTKKSDWMLSFNGRNLTPDNEATWAVTKDGGTFDSFTGATITPRAVVSAVHKTLQYYQQHQQDIYSINEVSEATLSTSQSPTTAPEAGAAQ